ncbi:zinc ribbon domain-containing protein [Kitasatospora aureofaciens]|uniref:zinc ribbon domain-containing protein n=1 Tax=Kitasatospora aureofaciens TaxID=1894 RepID=UPI003B976327
MDRSRDATERSSQATFQVCSACGVLDGPKPLAVREWTCEACGALHDRDLNASRNILAAGRADRLNACGGPVRPGVAIHARHSPLEQEPTGTPAERGPCGVDRPRWTDPAVIPRGSRSRCESPG